MHFGGFRADAQAGGDFLDAPAGGKEFENLAQARRQLCQLAGLNAGRLGHQASGGQVFLKVAEARSGQHQIGDIERQAADPSLSLRAGQRELEDFPPIAIRAPPIPPAHAACARPPSAAASAVRRVSLDLCVRPRADDGASHVSMRLGIFPTLRPAAVHLDFNA